MGRADRARRERPSRRLGFRPRCPKESGASSSTFARRLLRPAARLSQAAGLALVLAGLPLAAATLAGGEARAQTTPLLSTTMTVGSSGTERGYDNLNTFFGSLGTVTFTHGTTEHTIRQLLANSNTTQGVEFRLHPGAALDSGLVLEWAGETLPLDDATSTFETGTTRTFFWDQTWLAANASTLASGSYQSTLTNGSEVSVCVRTGTQSCSTTSTDATLSGLALTAGTDTVDLNETFASATEDYTASVGNAVDTITVTPSFTDSGASVTEVTLGGTAIADTDFTDGISVPSLVVGANTIEVEVTAEDGTTTKTYTVVVTRAAAGTCADPDLSGRTEVWTADLGVGVDPIVGLWYGYDGAGIDAAGTLSPNKFRIGTSPTEYTVGRLVEFSAPPALTFIVNTDIPQADGDKLRLHLCGDTFDLSDATVSEGRKAYVWSSVLLDWSTATTVKVALSRVAYSTDATLSALALADSGDNAVAFNETFAPGTVTYTANVANAVSTITVTPTTNDANAREPEFLDANDAALGDAYTMIDGFQVGLGVGDTTFKVKVTAEDGTTDETYTVTVTRAPAPAPEPMRESLVENISGASCGFLTGIYSAQSFTTGTDVAYKIDRVVMWIEVPLVGSPQGVVKIREDDGGTPGDLVEELTSPGTLTDGNNTFTAPSGPVLAKERKYWITTNEGVANSANRAVYCANSGNSQTGKPGWSIGNDRLSRSSESDDWGTSENSLVLSIQGTRMLSSDATLLALALADGDGEAVALTPAFAIDEMSYTASVATAVDEITVMATPKDANAAEPEFLDGTDATLTDPDLGTPGFQVALAEGENTIKVKVTAEDPDATETYTVTVTRRPPLPPLPTPTSFPKLAFFPASRARSSRFRFAEPLDVGVARPHDPRFAIGGPGGQLWGQDFGAWSIFRLPDAAPAVYAQQDTQRRRRHVHQGHQNPHRQGRAASPKPSPRALAARRRQGAPQNAPQSRHRLSGGEGEMARSCRARRGAARRPPAPARSRAGRAGRSRGHRRQAQGQRVPPRGDAGRGAQA